MGLGKANGLGGEEQKGFVSTAQLAATPSCNETVRIGVFSNAAPRQDDYALQIGTTATCRVISHRSITGITGEL